MDRVLALADATHRVFVHKALIPLSADGHSAGADTIIVREPIGIMQPVWLPGAREIAYLFSKDRSIIRRIAASPGAKPRDDGMIDGEFLSLCPQAAGRPTIACIYVHDNSLWRIDLQARGAAL